jgi:hypothetical protein
MKKVMKKTTVQLVTAEVIFKNCRKKKLLIFCFKGVELHTNEYASRHEENRLTATTKDHNIKRKLEVKEISWE